MSPMRRSPGVLLAVAIAFALAAWVVEWATPDCYQTADGIVCEVIPPAVGECLELFA